MGFGMCGTNKRTPPEQTAQEALDSIVPLGLRLYFQMGSGPGESLHKQILVNINV
jgi:hypothetical protein